MLYHITSYHNISYNVLILSKLLSPIDAQVNCLKTILKFTLKLTLKQLQPHTNVF